MVTPTKQHATEEFAVRDLGLAAALTASGWPVRLEDRRGIVYFIFHGDHTGFTALEDSYWDGNLELPAKELLMAQRSLKDRLYALKGGRR